MKYLGAHVSIAGGFDKCLDHISEMGGNCLMTFASSPRSLRTRIFSPLEIKKYLDKKAKLDIGPHFFHGVYLINLASENKAILETSLHSLIFYQRFAADIGAVGTIFHIGSHKGQGFSKTMDQIIASINYIMDSSPKGIRLIMENAAGQSGTIGADFQEFSSIISRVGDKSKIGFCLDTQHGFASGINLQELLTKFDRAVGLKHLSAIHLNNSLSSFNSHLDRHANLNEGTIDFQEIKNFINDPRIKNTPIILETPNVTHPATAKKELNLLKSLII